MKAFLEKAPNAPFFQTEFGFYCIDKWVREGQIPAGADFAAMFGYDPGEFYTLGHLGGCEAPFMPGFEEKQLEDRGEHELVQDSAGRKVLYFKNRRSGFMPEYVDHPVKDLASWKEKCLWRLDPNSPERLDIIKKAAAGAEDAQKNGAFMQVYLVGGYMYLRSLIGPLELLYMFYDDPDLIRACMSAWFDIMDSGLEIYQKHVWIDNILFDEDICYKTGSLISDEMIREFLEPYYTRLINNAKSRQTPKIHLQLATDGYLPAVMDRYISMGFDYFSPFEAAAGCDVVEIGKKYPDILMSGGIDKRVLAESKEAIDKMCDYIFPAMKARGGYFPTCDHGVPEEVSVENYAHYRKRCLEYK